MGKYYSWYKTNFNTVFSTGGLKFYLPYNVGNVSSQNSNDHNNEIYGIYNTVVQTRTGAINLSNDALNSSVAGHSSDTYFLTMDGEDKDDNIVGGTAFEIQLDQNTDGDLEVDQINTTGTFSGSGGVRGKEQGDTNIYETYVEDAVAPKILHYTKPDRDYAEVYYPTGNSESYAKVFLTSTSATSVPEGGAVLVKDSEVSSVATKNLIIVGGSCINSAAATLVGGASCGSAWTTATSIGSGQFLVKAYPDSTLTSGLAMLVAGYEAADTQAASTYVRTQTFDSSAVATQDL